MGTSVAGGVTLSGVIKHLGVTVRFRNNHPTSNIQPTAVLRSETDTDEQIDKLFMEKL